MAGCPKKLAPWNRSGLCTRHFQYSGHCSRCGKRISYEREKWCIACYLACRAASRIKFPCAGGCQRKTRAKGGVCLFCKAGAVRQGSKNDKSSMADRG
jgi:hypothetical protein